MILLQSRRALPALAIATAALLHAPGARAGDTANLDILGFSADGAVFAFEEYGVQDGSGFPYANRYYIKTADDSFAAGSPVRVRIDDENATVADARAKARQQGEAIVTEATLTANQGFTAGFNAVTERSADPYRMEVNPRPVEPPIDAPLEVRLTERPFPATGPCEIAGSLSGFTLTLVDPAPDGVTRLLAHDETVPQSRGCPTGYRIGAVQTLYPQGGEPVMAVMIAVRGVGFEGPDYRWLAVTAPVAGGETP